MNDPATAGLPHDAGLDQAGDTDENGAAAEANELNHFLDGLNGEVRAADRHAAWHPALTLLSRADARTPDPDAAFVRSLRVRLVEPAPHAATSKLSARLGIVATVPACPLGAPVTWPDVRRRRTVLTAVAAVAAVLLALVRYEPSWMDGNGHSFGVPTALASSTAVQIAATPSPAGLPTVTAGYDRRPGESVSASAGH